MKKKKKLPCDDFGREKRETLETVGVEGDGAGGLE